MDCLNIHVSESLVRWIAEEEKIPAVTLGRKGQSGILQSMETRAKFLSNTEHKIVFNYTPKHFSWLNQIEIWQPRFLILWLTTTIRWQSLLNGLIRAKF